MRPARAQPRGRETPLLRLKSTRPPALKPVPAAPAPAAPVENTPHTVESLGQQLREVLPTRRLHSVSLCDHEANIVWLSEGALGPDEHSLVVEALAVMAADTSLPCHEMGLEDGRLALFLPVRGPSSELVGIAMIITDGRSIGDDTLERMTAAPVRAIMLRLAILLKPGDAPADPPAEASDRVFADAASSLSAEAADSVLAETEDILAALDEASGTPKASEPEPAPEPAPELMSPEEVNDILEFELSPEETASFRIPVIQPSEVPAPAPAKAAPTKAAPPKATPPRATPPRATPPKAAPVKAAPAAVADPSSEMMLLEFVNDPPPAPAPAPAPAARPAAWTRPVPAATAARAAPPVAAPPPPPDTPVAPPARPAARPASRARAIPRTAPAAVPAAPAAPRVLAPPAAPAAQPPAAAPSAAATAPAVSAPVVTAPLVSAAAPAPAAVNDPNLLLELLPYAKLRAGGQTRRFQLLARTSVPQRDPAAQDALVLQRLLGWLAAHRGSWNSQPTGFTVNLSIATLEDERFPQKIAAALNTHGIAGDTLGFNISEALCTQSRAQVERFIGQCEKVGSWIVIDDFSFDAQVLPLLRSRAVRLVKIDAKLSSSALKDKLAQAMVVAIVQAAKVLGIHCGAKKVDSQAALQWLTAIGCDLAQGAAVAPVQPLDALAGSPDPTGLNVVLR